MNPLNNTAEPAVLVPDKFGYFLDSGGASEAGGMAVLQAYTHLLNNKEINIAVGIGVEAHLKRYGPFLQSLREWGCKLSSGWKGDPADACQIGTIYSNGITAGLGVSGAQLALLSNVLEQGRAGDIIAVMPGRDWITFPPRGGIPHLPVSGAKSGKWAHEFLEQMGVFDMEPGTFAVLPHLTGSDMRVDAWEGKFVEEAFKGSPHKLLGGTAEPNRAHPFGATTNLCVGEGAMIIKTGIMPPTLFMEGDNKNPKIVLDFAAEPTPISDLRGVFVHGYGFYGRHVIFLLTPYIPDKFTGEAVRQSAAAPFRVRYIAQAKACGYHIWKATTVVGQPAETPQKQ